MVAIGGGTGLSTLLRGLKRYTIAPGDVQPAGRYISELTAVVTVSDDGGSSGRLRRELGMLPPGDVRNCLVALSEDANLLSQLFQHRFSSSGDLEGHSFGNLFLAALTAMTGDFAVAVKKASEILTARGHILPATAANVELEAEMDDGSRVRGETSISASEKRIVELTIVPAHPEPLPETLAAIARADVITIGPGSLFTSLIPNLLVRGIPEAIRKSPALKIFICNLMTEANESLHLTASAHIAAIHAHAGSGLFNYAFVNSAVISEAMQRRYAAEQAEPVVCDTAAIQALGIRCIAGNFLQENEMVRHDTEMLCRELLRLAQTSARELQVAGGR